MEMLIYALEGIDGAGKSTQVKLVKKSLEQKGLQVQILKSPSDSLFGNFLRDNVKKLDSRLKLQLFLLDIKFSMENADKRNIILCDRYINSFYTSNKEMNLFRSIDITKDLPKATKNFFLDISVKDALKRKTHDHSIKSWLKVKQKRYYELLKLDPNIIRIDANQQKKVITKKIVEEILNNG